MTTEVRRSGSIRELEIDGVHAAPHDEDAATPRVEQVLRRRGVAVDGARVEAASGVEHRHFEPVLIQGRLVFLGLEIMRPRSRRRPAHHAGENLAAHSKLAGSRQRTNAKARAAPKAATTAAPATRPRSPSPQRNLVRTRCLAPRRNGSAAATRRSGLDRKSRRREDGALRFDEGMSESADALTGPRSCVKPMPAS